MEDDNNQAALAGVDAIPAATAVPSDHSRLGTGEPRPSPGPSAVNAPLPGCMIRGVYYRAKRHWGATVFTRPQTLLWFLLGHIVETHDSLDILDRLFFC